MERDRKMKVKLYFLGFVGVLVAITLFLYFKNSGMEDKSDSQVTDEDVTQETESHEKEVNDEEVKKIEDKYKDDVADADIKKDNQESKEKSENEQKQKEEDTKESDFDYESEGIGYDDIDSLEDDFNYEKDIKDRIGKKHYKDVMKKSEKAIEMFAKGKNKGWKDIASKDLQEKIKSGEVELLNVKKLKSSEVFPTEQVNDDDVIIGSIITYGDKTKSYSLIFVERNDEYVLDEIVLMWGS